MSELKTSVEQLLKAASSKDAILQLIDEVEKEKSLTQDVVVPNLTQQQFLEVKEWLLDGVSSVPDSVVYGEALNALVVGNKDLFLRKLLLIFKALRAKYPQFEV